MELIIIILILIIAYFIYKNFLINKSNEPIKKEFKTSQEPNYMPYAKGNLLTTTEQAFFVILTREALKRRLLVCPKVRLEDIIYVTDKVNRNKYRGFIKSRHIDFVLVNSKCETVAAIELDDISHNTKKAAKADQFKNELFYTVHIPLIRIYAGTDYIKEINYAFDTLNFPKQENKNQQHNS